MSERGEITNKKQKKVRNWILGFGVRLGTLPAYSWITHYY
jgi:hypothetical protein